MPLADFQCEKCQHVFEENVKVGDLAPCPNCGSTETQRLMGAPLQVGVASISYKSPFPHKGHGKPKPR